LTRSLLNCAPKVGRGRREARPRRYERPACGPPVSRWSAGLGVPAGRRRPTREWVFEQGTQGAWRTFVSVLVSFAPVRGGSLACTDLVKRLATATYGRTRTLGRPTAKRVSGFNPIRGSNPRTSAMTRGNAHPGHSPGGALWGLFGGLASFLVSVEAGAVPDTHGRQQACPARAEPNPANGPISCSWVWERSNGGLDAPIGSDRGHVGQSGHGRCQRVRSPCPPRVACTWCLWRGRGRGSVAR
jgi:hypothetical protein